MNDFKNDDLTFLLRNGHRGTDGMCYSVFHEHPTFLLPRSHFFVRWDLLKYLPGGVWVPPRHLLGGTLEKVPTQEKVGRL